MWSEPQVLTCWSNARALSHIRFLIHRSFRIAFFLHVIRTSNEYFLFDREYYERVSPASNAPRCGVLAAETKTAASSQRPPTTQLAECSTFDASIMRSGQSIYILCCVFSIHHPIRTGRISYFKSACVLIFSYLGRQSELTFVGTIS